jgi:RNA polymerase-interacting CarD/CdnL/TRCF family regulator
VKYIVKLTEQEEMNLRQLMIQPGAEVIFKLLQMESLDAQASAMNCVDPDEKRRLLLLTDAQRTAQVVSSLTRKLNAYREIVEGPAFAEADEIITNLWNQREN